ncbi:isoprenoid synthase domain-containing protein [Lactarius deliciosus]|nr:isoprenoid synthase domain-containing protein [Lactarius deliciosus]
MANIATSPVPSCAPFPRSGNEEASGRQHFEAMYTIFLGDLLDNFRKHNMPEKVIEYCLRSMNYNVPGGKLNRGLSVVDSVAILKGRELTDEEYFKAAVLGCRPAVDDWFEMQAYILVMDDIMDSSITRRGQPCWYRLEGVGSMAINDALVMEGAIFQMIRKHFRTEPFYVDMLDLLQEGCHVIPPFSTKSLDRHVQVLYRTEMGQLVDLITAPGHSVDLSKFSLARYKTIVIYKTALYSFYLPVALALLLCGFPVEKWNESDPEYYKIALDILVPLGVYFQIQDDYLDYSGTPEQIGKIGTDIVDNKCSWCINVALARANPTQRAILDANYGRKDPEAEARVKEVFREVGIDAVYADYEAKSYAHINALISAVPEVESPNGDAVLRRTVFRVFLEKIYKRTKELSYYSAYASPQGLDDGDVSTSKPPPRHPHPVLNEEYDRDIVIAGVVRLLQAARLHVSLPRTTTCTSLLEPGPLRLLSHLAPNSRTVRTHVSRPSAVPGGCTPTVPCGQCLSGRGSVNFVIYVPQSASDYDDWEKVYRISAFVRKARNAMGSSAALGLRSRDCRLRHTRSLVGLLMAQTAHLGSREEGFSSDLKENFLQTARTLDPDRAQKPDHSTDTNDLSMCIPGVSRSTT